MFLPIRLLPRVVGKEIICIKTIFNAADSLTVLEYGLLQGSNFPTSDPISLIWESPLPPLPQ